MRLDHLSFAQLYKLSQPEVLMRVNRAYHKALRRARGPEYKGWSVYAAETDYPEIKKRYKPVLDFLRGAELKQALRRAADSKKITVHSAGYLFPFMTLNQWKFPHPQARIALATLIMKHCRETGVKAAFYVLEDRVEIRVACGPLGQKLLRYKRGLRLGDIDKFCWEMRIPIWGPFPWIPAETPRGVRINPCVWPTNTPDVNEITQELIL